MGDLTRIDAKPPRTPEQQAAIDARVARMQAGKAARLAAGDTTALGGPKRKRRASSEEKIAQDVLRESIKEALEKLGLRDLALTNLADMLKSNDVKRRDTATKLVLEWTDGKAAQTIVNQNEGPLEIVYRTAALGEGVPAFVPEAWTPDG